MSRLFLNKSIAVIRRTGAASTSNDLWKLLLCHVNHCQPQQCHRQRRYLSSSALSSSLVFRQALAVNASFSPCRSYGPQCCRLLSSKCNQEEGGQDGQTYEKCLTMKTINPLQVAMEFAIRGPIVIRAGAIEKELEEGIKKPFEYVIRANIGDCHATGQKPNSFIRKLITCTFEPDAMTTGRYGEDLVSRACTILEGCQGSSVGSYTEASGLEVVRRQVADFIAARDGFPSDWQNIYLTAGATSGIKSLLSLLVSNTDGKKTGIMVPVPAYPLYSATLTEYGLERIDYYLDEETGWSLTTEELQRAYDEAKKICTPRALAVINPGNPTGQVLTKQNIEEVIKFALKNKLIIMSDEVYQLNIYDPNSEFHSFKKVINEMGPPYNQMELASFMSASKAYLGECGIRGGTMELANISPDVMATYTKSISSSMCSTTAGQVAVSGLVNPPKPGEASYDEFIADKDGVLGSLRERAELVYATLNSLEGFSTNKIMGALYTYPQFSIPPKAIEEANAKKMAPDAFYCTELLEKTGICVVPGSGFGQKEGTYHFRSTILPQTPIIKEMMNKFQKFHVEFMKKYK